MAKQDWASCKIPVRMADSIDRVLESDAAKKNGIFSRTDFLTVVVRIWFSRYEKDFGMFVGKDMIRGAGARAGEEEEEEEPEFNYVPMDYTF